MATIVTQYNPWREQLAMSFLGPLVHNMIQRSQIADDNRKLNALMGELAAGDAGMGDPSGLQNAAMGSDPWERSFFQNDARGGALGQFDAAMGMGQGAPTPQAGTLNPVADMQRLYQLMASKRFGMVDPKAAMALAQPYLAQRQAQAQAQAAAAAQAQRQAAMQAWGNQWAGMNDPTESMKQLILGSGQGFVDKAVVGDWMNYLKHMNPHQQYKSENFGDKITGFAFDPITGQANPIFSGAVGMNPYQAGSLENERARIAETGRHNLATEGITGTHYQNTDALAAARFNAEQEAATYARQNPNVHSVRTDENGIVWNVFNNGTAAPAMRPDGTPIRVAPKAERDTTGKLSDIDKKAYERAYDENAEYQKELDKINNTLKKSGYGEWTNPIARNIPFTNYKDRNELLARKAELEQKIQANSNTIREIISRSDPNHPLLHGGAAAQGPQQQGANTGNLGTFKAVADLVKNNAGISSRYGKRGSGHHNGTDIAAAEGSPVMSPGSFTVSRVVNDRHGGGYGVNVTLSGKDANGDNVEMLFAHLQPGSVRVKQGQAVNPGDVLAGVGNTGRVRGKNGGYHLHFEVKVNGKNVDPEKYMKGAQMKQVETPKSPELNAMDGQVKGQSVGPMMQGIASGDASQAVHVIPEHQRGMSQDERTRDTLNNAERSPVQRPAGMSDEQWAEYQAGQIGNIDGSPMAGNYQAPFKGHYQNQQQTRVVTPEQFDALVARFGQAEALRMMREAGAKIAN